MVLNDRLLASKKDGLSNSLNLINQDFYIRQVDKKTKKTIASLQAVPSPSRASPSALILTFLPFYSLPRRLLKPRLLDLELNALPMRPLCLPTPVGRIAVYI